MGQTLCLSDTFVTIETKDGQSTEKIPFMRFMQTMMLDHESGNLKVDIAHLLSKPYGSSLTVEGEKSNGDRLSMKDSGSSASGVTSTLNEKPDTKETPLEKRAVKSRGRPRKVQNDTKNASENSAGEQLCTKNMFRRTFMRRHAGQCFFVHNLCH